MVFKILNSYRVINIWFIRSCNAYMPRVGKGSPLQDEYNGGACQSTGYFFWDNMIVVNRASIPESKLSKKHFGIFYHDVNEAYTAGI